MKSSQLTQTIFNFMPDSISFPVLQSWKVLSNAQFLSHLTIITTQVKKRILLICTFFRLSSNGLVMEDEMTLDGAIISASFDEALETVSFILFLHLLLISCHCNHYYINRINGVHVVIFKRDRKSTRLNSGHVALSRMPSSA